MSKVQTVEAIPVSYPEPNDYDALRHLCLVKITTDDGVVGWGESITQFPEANFAVKAIIEGMAERVVGKDPLDNIAIWHSLRDQMWWYGYSGGIASYAVAAIDIALWDIKGKLLNVPVVQLLGGAVHEKLPAVASSHAHYEDIDRMVEEAQEWVAPGHARPEGRLRQARQRAAGLRARPGCRVHPQDARGPGPRPDDHDRLRLEREMGRHDRRPPRPGLRRVRPALDRGAARRLGSRRATPTCAARRPRSSPTARRSGTSTASSGSSRRARSTWSGWIPGRAEGITGFKRAVERLEYYRRQANAHCWSSAIVTAASLAMSLQLTGLQAHRGQAAAQPDAARAGARAHRARGRLVLPADQARPGHRCPAGRGRPLSEREGPGPMTTSGRRGQRARGGSR